MLCGITPTCTITGFVNRETRNRAKNEILPDSRAPFRMNGYQIGLGVRNPQNRIHYSEKRRITGGNRREHKLRIAFAGAETSWRLACTGH